MREFESPARTLGDLDVEVAGRLIAAAADVALIVDDKGVIRDLAFGSEDLLREGCDDWLGKPWAETVTIESRPKVDRLLRDSRSNAAPRWLHINHPSAAGADLPMSYAAIALPRTGRGKAVGQAVVFGRDLRATPRCNSDWSVLSRRWSATAGASAIWKRATGRCSSWPPRPC